MKVSVITCTHNPRPHYFKRVLEALRAQTLSRDRWELVIIDNASRDRVADQWDLTWHPDARCIREGELGVTRARLRGISESKGDLLVFVDDDNLLSANYLEQAVELAARWPTLGAWGADITGEFEAPPPAWTKEYLGFVAVRECKSEIWSNDPMHWQAQPCGAGMCFRREVGLRWVADAQQQPWKLRLGRVGDSLSNCEDTDLLVTSCDLGLGFGIFPALQVTHLIPQSRLTEDYLVRLVQDTTMSCLQLLSLRLGRKMESRGSAYRFARALYSLLFLSPRARRFEKARRRGERKARESLAELEKDFSS